MAKASCKCKPTECEECPEWIFTFADLVMLMMGFFVILWVLKPAPNPPKNGEQDQVLPLELLAAIREAFGHLPDPSSKDPVDVFMLMKKLEQLKPMKGEGDGGKTKLDRKVPEGSSPEVEVIRPSKQVGLGARVMFAPGDATLTPEAKAALDTIWVEIQGRRVIVVIKGHASTDDLPEGASEDAKMTLSTRRAQAAAEYLAEKGKGEVGRDTIRVQGCSTFEPVVERPYSAEARAQNRRVEVESTGMLVKELQDNLKDKERRAKTARDIDRPAGNAADPDAPHKREATAHTAQD